MAPARPSAVKPVAHPLAAAERAELHLKDLLQTVNGAIRTRDLDRALRAADRVWRHARDDAQITHLYARLLIRTGEHAAALRLLATLPPDPDIAAQTVECLLAAGETDAASARLAAALRQYCVEPGGPLAEAARRMIEATAHGCRGWIGVGPTLELVGAVLGAPPNAHIELSGADPRVATATLRASSSASATFRLAPPQQAHDALDASVAGVPLLGSGLRLPPEFDLDGRATDRNGRVSGWVRLGWRPSAAVELVLEDERGARTRIASEPEAGARGRRSFAVDPAAAGLEGNEIVISALLPDGTARRLPDAPLLLDEGIRPFAAGKSARRASSKPAPPCPRPVAIVVPVYLGRDETMRAIEALLATLRSGDEAVVIDDASPDPKLAAALDALAAKGAITLLRNEQNLGFAATVNRGLALRPDRDAILLNADTVVFGDWIDRLQRAASKDRATGTATPLTNRGAVASYPGGREGDCTDDEAAALDRIAAAVNPGAATDLPVGVGFCLYLRRDCLAETGVFDAATFGKGYGEENDFCLRAAKRGWRHVLAGDVFVHHAGGRSFGTRAAALRERNRRLLNLRHPGYDALVEAFVAADPARPLRRRIAEARLAGSGDRHALLLTLDLPGGVERHVRERCRILRDAGLAPLLLRPDTAGGAAISGDDARYGDLAYRIPDELPALRALLAKARIDHVELHHFLNHDRRTIEAVMALGVPYDVYVHDYAWVCPRLGLVDGAGRYCGEPSVAACEVCVKRNGSSLGETISVGDLRRRSARWLAPARDVIVPCEDVATRLKRYFPAIKPRISPWEAPPRAGMPPAPRAGIVRVALIGAIGEHKGYRLLRACAEDAAKRRLPLEFVVLGYSEDDQPLLDTGKVFVTGRYEEPELPELIRRERPNLVLFPSVTPETWCFALTEALRSGVPIAALAHGALAERLRGSETSILIPVDAEPARINDRLLAAAGARGEFDRHRQKPSFAAPLPSTNLTAVPAQEFEQMDKIDRSPPVTRENAISGSVEVITIPKGQYRFAVKSGAPARATGAGALSVPAVHVGLGPGVPPGAATLTPKQRGNGHWLFQPGDALVAKITGATATLVLTSVRAPGGLALAIEVDRLDGKRAAAPVTAPVEPQSLRTEILAHVRNRGDMPFANVEWAGRVGSGLWIEAFAVKPLEGIGAGDIEYKGLTRTGIETPWIGNGGLCGTRGMSVALIGFAARLKPEAGANYDCEYAGYFQSGTTVGPLRNGAPCRSTVPNDPLEGIRLRIVPRTATASTAAAPEAAPATARRGPQFSKFREELEPADTPRSGTSPTPPKRDAKPKPHKPPPAARRAKPAPPRKRTAAQRRPASA